MENKNNPCNAFALTPSADAVVKEYRAQVQG